MDISTALSADLKNLLRVLDLPDLDVEQALRGLRFDVGVAVTSFVGLAMTLVVEGQPVTLTSMEAGSGDRPIASSLRLPLALTGAAAPGSELVLYAASAGAFVDLAADLSYALGSDDDALLLDAHLQPSARTSGLSGVTELSMINRAIGVLIGRGATPEQARRQLEDEATRSQLAVFRVAADLISDTE